MDIRELAKRPKKTHSTAMSTAAATTRRPRENLLRSFTISSRKGISKKAR